MKYQIVIGREARRELGIEPRWVAVETVVGDHLEMRFLPPGHARSLAGELGSSAKRDSEPDEEESAWESHVGQRFPLERPS